MNLELTDRIQKTWYELCKDLVPCHNPDLILRQAFQTKLENLVHMGTITAWAIMGLNCTKSPTNLELASALCSIYITIVPGPAELLDVIYMVTKIPIKINLNERWNFDE